MRSVLYTAAALLFAASGASAMAGGPVIGRVTSANWSTGALTLQSGDSFQFEPASRLYGVVSGQMIGVSHDGQNGIATFAPYGGRTSNGRPR